MPVLDRYLGLARSLRIYYGDLAHFGRMRCLYGQFIRPGDLCFDIGAHVGSRLRVWARMGARVIAVEPHPMSMRFLRKVYGRARDVELVEAAVGAREGEQEMLICDREPTISTLSPEWATRLHRERRTFAHVRWDRSVRVPVTTLDALIGRFGLPAFCKIDVEGYDLEVLNGLSQPLPALSFEYVPPALDLALACFDRLRQLGPYEFNWSPGESMRFALPEWADVEEVVALLEAVPADGECGDVYARLRAG